ncbi:hypothetical protein D8S78_06340 [Natrialba swarupiae]|nr:hypothetical protein [Natrialba swarupiae]
MDCHTLRYRFAKSRRRDKARPWRLTRVRRAGTRLARGTDDVPRSGRRARDRTRESPAPPAESRSTATSPRTERGDRRRPSPRSTRRRSAAGRRGVPRSPRGRDLRSRRTRRPAA